MWTVRTSQSITVSLPTDLHASLSGMGAFWEPPSAKDSKIYCEQESKHCYSLMALIHYSSFLSLSTCTFFCLHSERALLFCCLEAIGENNCWPFPELLSCFTCLEFAITSKLGLLHLARAIAAKSPGWACHGKFALYFIKLQELFSPSAIIYQY